MKNVWKVLLPCLLLVSRIGALECNPKDNCLCLRGSEFEFQCPENSEDSQIIIHVQDGEKVRMDCVSTTPHTNKSYISLLPNVTLERVDAFSIRFCPLPNNNFREILDRFSLQEVNLLQFGNSDIAGVTLRKDYFTGLKTLKNLKLNFINITNLEDDVFADTPNLISLELQGNAIHLRPKIFEKVPALKSLDLSENQLSGIPDNLFQSLENLQILHLWGNKLSALDKGTFDGLYNLSSLELSANVIETIDEDSFYNLTNLKQINLSFNKIKLFPARLLINNKNLVIFKLRGNKVRLDLEDFLLSNLPSLQQIDLTNCKINAIPEHIFENSTNLKSVVLATNNISYLPQNIFAQLDNLQEINLNDNKIQDISQVFALLKNLKKLLLSNNAIMEIDKYAFTELRQLEEIDLSRNKITAIYHNAFAYKDNLKKINLSYNLYGKKDRFALLEDAHNVVTVDLSHNLITQVEDVIVLYNKVNLTSLDLSNNRISSIVVQEFQPLGKKLVINLENNAITTVDFRYIERIAREGGKKDAMSLTDSRQSIIKLSYNPINCDCFNYDLLRYFRGEISPEVKVLFDIRADTITCANPPELEDQIIDNYAGCPEKCTCSWRPFDKSIIIDCSGRNLGKLPIINMAQNHGIPFNQTELHLEQNNLTLGPDRNLSGYENITKLYLSHNQIKNIFWLPSKLEVLSLDNNDLEMMGGSVLDSLNTSYLKSLSLHDNPWRCECEADNFTNFLRHHSIQVDTKLIYCFNSTTRLIDLNRNDLCHEWQLVYTVLLVITVLLMISISVALYYRYQQELKVWLFAHSFCLWWVTEEELDKDKIYDAFISYSHKDEEFITQNILPVLEGGPQPYQLCLHYRNWIPGEFITKQVTNSVFESKRTLVLLSPNFLESVWGKMEFRTAHTQAMTDGRARVIVVLYGDIDVDKLDPELKTYLKTNTYVKWGDPYFWNKLKYALPHSKRVSSINQKHANVMNTIDDKFTLVNTPVTASPGSTPPVVSADGGLLKKHPLNFVPASSLDTPPAESGTLLTATIS